MSIETIAVERLLDQAVAGLLALGKDGDARTATTVSEAIVAGVSVDTLLDRTTIVDAKGKVKVLPTARMVIRAAVAMAEFGIPAEAAIDMAKHVAKDEEFYAIVRKSNTSPEVRQAELDALVDSRKSVIAAMKAKRDADRKAPAGVLPSIATSLASLADGGYSLTSEQKATLRDLKAVIDRLIA